LQEAHAAPLERRTLILGKLFRDGLRSYAF